MKTTNYDWICENVHSTHKHKYIPRNTILKYSIHYISRMHEATCVQSSINLQSLMVVQLINSSVS